jgi:ParB-like chromosome segregation protein Spo0J
MQTRERPGTPPKESPTRIDHWHPFAEKFPPLAGEEWEAFKASIRRTRGNRVPVIYRMKDGKAEGIDGRNRYRACEELGLTCRMEEELLDDDKVKEFILDRNVHRRHLTPELRRELVAELRADGKSVRGIAEALGVGKSTVERDLRTHQETPVPNGTPATVTGQDGKSYQSRAERVGPGALKPYVLPSERMAGDETEQIERDKKADRKARAQDGKPVFEDKQVTDSIGKLAKLFNDRAKALKQEKSQGWADVREAMNGLLTAWDSWRGEK